MLGRKEKGSYLTLFPIALFHTLIFIDTGYKCDASLFKVNLAGGVYEAHGEGFSFDPLCLPVHTVGTGWRMAHS